ncbi:MAG TPA: AmmeMemoRadiSam system protein A [Candidatus Acidoferrum sp.]|jgi:AmmeMemoRadiSam system protein A|nr:AmmeMemoRadiSam system protein A [Candidatus Acidoferrum sp.]
MKKQDLAGKWPILTLLHLERLKGWKAHLLQYRRRRAASSDRNSARNPAGTALSAPVAEPLEPPDRSFLLRLARQAVASAVANTAPPEVKDVVPRLTEKQACFVTLTAGGALRGCIGHLLPRLPLYQAVIESARNAALRDPRFPPVLLTEMDALRIEISVLTQPTAVSYNSPEDLLSKLLPGEHGVLLHIGPRLATFLPRVWAQIHDKVEFLDRLAEKAGCCPTAWRGKDATVSIYYAECFEEAGPVPLHN